MKQLLFFVFLVFSSATYAQVSVFEEPSVTRMMNAYIGQARSSTHVQGWRIQLVTTNDRRKMETVRGKFASLYPGIDISWKHVNPYYHVQIGAYRTKLELQNFLLRIKSDFPNAIPVRDKIRKVALLN